MPYNYLSTLRAIAEQDPSRVLVAAPEARLTAGELLDASARLAGRVARNGVGPGHPLAIMLWNRPEFAVAFFAALQLGAAPVNVNPRYGAPEILAILRDCDARTLVHERDLAPADVAALHDAGVASVASGEEWTAALAGPPIDWREPTVDDVLINYTGGTTGRPKGVVWNIDEHYRMLWEIVRPGTDPPDPQEVAGGVRRAPTTMPLSPLAHATAQGLALNTWNGGGKVVMTGSPSFDAEQALALIEDEAVAVLGIVGDVFARPLLDALDAAPRALPTLRVISSSGAVWSPGVRARLKDHLPHVRLIDNYGSTEALITRNADDGTTFERRDGVVVLDRELRPLAPGTGEVGLIATSGRLPVGYLNDPERTAATFPVIDGVRHLVVGDEALLEADGTIRMLGRGNACINTGGEKVWPEEVEGVLLGHPGVRDVVVLGEPSEQWGQQVVAVVALATGAAPTDRELAAHARAALAGYKVPKRFVAVADVPRTFAGKPDYERLRQIVADGGAAS